MSSKALATPFYGSLKKKGTFFSHLVPEAIESFFIFHSAQPALLLDLEQSIPIPAAAIAMRGF